MRRLATATLLLLSAPLAHASNFDINCSLLADCHSAFHDVAKDVAAAINYKQLGPAEPSGLLGVSVGAIASYTPTQNKDAWRTLTGEDVKGIGMVGVVATKGLPYGIDVGAFYAPIPSTGAKAYGAQLRYAILEGGVAEPALAVGAHYTKSSGVHDFDYSAWGADAVLSKGFLFLTPYVGAGFVSSSLKPSAEMKTNYGLDDEKISTGRIFVGTRISMLLFNVTPEYERSGNNNVYSLRAGFSF